MTDIYDQATEKEEQERALALASIRLRANSKPQLLPVGLCHNCEAILDPPKLFCDSDCRDDWQKRNQ